MKNFIQQILIAILAVYKKDDELIGFYICDFIQQAVKPLVFLFVCGSYAADLKNKFVKLIEPTVPDFSINS